MRASSASLRDFDGSAQLRAPASGHSVVDASTWPIRSRRRRHSPRSGIVWLIVDLGAAECQAHAAIVRQALVMLGQLPLEPRKIVHRRRPHGGFAVAVPHQHHQVAQRLVQQALALDHAFQHHGVAAGIQEASQPTVIFAPAPRH